MLWAPSWGGMLNGLLTLRGAWNKLRVDPVIKFFAAGVTFYGMATFEGPLLSIKAVNGLGHYTDWIIGHVHVGTLGWNGFMAAGMFYWLAPRLRKTKLHSESLANMHFWLGLVGILLYVASMWVSGITQGLMLNSTTDSGTVLTYPNFIDTLIAIRPMMFMRIVGGGLYLIGFFMLAYNIFRTVKAGTPVNGVIKISTLEMDAKRKMSTKSSFFNAPVIYSFLVILFACGWSFAGEIISFLSLIALIFVAILAIIHFEMSSAKWHEWYEKLLENAFPFTVLTLIAIGLGGVIEIVPTLTIDKASNIEGKIQVPLSPLELAGRDIYIREGCFNCHSQMVRPMVPDVLRYGDYSRMGESIYDHPFQWGSKRTGPDLARIAGKYPDVWHYIHMKDPRATSQESNMPNYPWLFEQDTDFESLPAKIAAMQTLGVPYPNWTATEIHSNANAQAEGIADTLKESGSYTHPQREIVALIAYLQNLGKSTEQGNP